MPAPPDYLDECVDHALVTALRDRGFAATAAVDEGLTELTDADQLTFASARG